jgi:hypothetical protein
MLVIIKKDDATSISREVADMAEARALALGGMPVFVQNDDGSQTPVSADDAAPDETPAVDGETQPPADETVADEPAAG